jgi:hypothetical protein
MLQPILRVFFLLLRVSVMSNRKTPADFRVLRRRSVVTRYLLKLGRKIGTARRDLGGNSVIGPCFQQ